MTSQLHIPPELARAAQELGFAEWTDIQTKAIPLIQQGKDVIGQSYTGSGKTAAFGIPILEKVVHGRGLQSLIIVPTRELCEQVAGALQKLARYKRTDILAVYGGVAIEPQISRLRTVDIVVGTPGRILDHMQRRTIDLRRIRIFVLDEADKMFEMGFIDDVKRIIGATPHERQTLLFSATISEQVHDIARHYMKHPERVKVQSYVSEDKLAQHYYDVRVGEKFSLLVHLLKHKLHGHILIFCGTRWTVDQVCENLQRNGVKAEALHGGLAQDKRLRTIDLFHKRGISTLVASDVAARGLDIKNVSHVVNYDIPKTAREYIHRIGRTARAGSEGTVVSLVVQPDHDNFRRVLQDRSLNVEKLALPHFAHLPFVAQRQRYERRGPRLKRGFQRRRY